MRRRRDDYIDPDELAANRAVQHYYAKVSDEEADCPVVDCEVCRSDEWIREYVRARADRKQVRDDTEFESMEEIR